jgi:dipeptidyl aminopeptidase/acylaminoacyl peptidase
VGLAGRVQGVHAARDRALGQLAGRRHDPIRAIQAAGRRPVYIVHSPADTRIAVQQSEQLVAAGLEAGVDVTAWFPESAEHVQTPAVYPQEFKARMAGFFRKALGE